MLIVHLFVSYAHVNLCHIFSSSWYQGLAATSACGSSWTFLFTFLHEDMVEIQLMLQAFLAEDPEIEYLFCDAPSGSKKKIKRQ